MPSYASFLQQEHDTLDDEFSNILHYRESPCFIKHIFATLYDTNNINHVPYLCPKGKRYGDKTPLYAGFFTTRTGQLAFCILLTLPRKALFH